VVELLTALLVAFYGPPRDLTEAQAAFEEGLRRRDSPAEARPFFRRAAASYERAGETGLASAGLYRTLGNAHFLAGNLPQAVFAYRRGLRLDPTDAKLHAHLAAARRQLAPPADGPFGRPPDVRRPWLHVFGSPGYRLLLTCFVYSLAWPFFVAWLASRRQVLLVATLALWVAAAVMGLDVGLDYRQEDLACRYPLVVVIADGVTVRTGNGTSYPPRFEAPVPAGVEARLRFRRGDWIQIEFAGGEVGWVPGDAALVDLPSSGG
jgi:hypothetical protein